MSEANTNRKRIIAPDGVTVIVTHEYVGKQSVEDALLPVVLEDISKCLLQNRTIDRDSQSA